MSDEKSMLKSLQHIKFDKKSMLLVWGGARQWLRHVPESVLLVHNRILELGFLGVFAISSIWIAVYFLYALEPQDQVAQRKPELLVSTINELELYIEEEYTAYENPPSFSEQLFY